MCMTIVIRDGARAWVAADRKWNFKYFSGRIVRKDLGGKVRRVPGGVVAFSGDGFVGAAGLDLLEVLGMGGLPEIPRLYRTGELRAFDGQEPLRTVFLGAAAEEPRPVLVGSYLTGEQALPPGSDFTVSWPPEVDEAAQNRLCGEFLSAWVAARGEEEKLQALSALFERTAAIAPSMSPTMDVERIP